MNKFNILNQIQEEKMDAANDINSEDVLMTATTTNTSVDYEPMQITSWADHVDEQEGEGWTHVGSKAKVLPKFRMKKLLTKVKILRHDSQPVCDTPMMEIENPLAINANSVQYSVKK